MKIDCNLPFEWCQNCKAIQLDTAKSYSDGEIYTENYCKNDSTCKECEQARKKVEDRIICSACLHCMEFKDGRVFCVRRDGVSCGVSECKEFVSRAWLAGLQEDNK